MKKYLILITILSLLALWPFFKKGYFESHDGEWMVIRFSAFHGTLAAGQFPVRFVDRLNNNYGYPVPNFLYPLPFYLAEIPKVLGIGFVDSIKTVFVLSSVFSAVAMFWALSLVFDKKAATSGAILYLYSPYRFVDLYVRGSLGESVAFAILPLILGCLFKITQGRRIYSERENSDIHTGNENRIQRGKENPGPGPGGTYLPILSISVALLILSHNVIALLFLPFFLIISLILGKNLKLILLYLAIGILVASFFWLPAIFDLQYVRLSQIKVSEVGNHLADFAQLLIPADPIPVQIGIVGLFVIAASLVVGAFNKFKDRLLIFFILAFVTVSFLMTKQSLFFWQSVPMVDVIQFPWRLLSLIVFIVSFLAAYLINMSRSKQLLMIIAAAAAIVSTITYTQPRVFTQKDEGFYTTNEGSTTVRDEYLPLWVKDELPGRAQNKIELLGPGTITSQTIRPANYQASISTPADTRVQINTIYFPGWQVKLDGKITSIDYSNNLGLITFNLPQGSHQVIIKYGKTPVHLISELVSIMALLALSASFFTIWRKQNF